MNFLNRAFKNVTRKFSKTILLTLTFFLIGNLVIVGLGISKASENAKVLTRKKMRAVVTYQLDYDEIYEYAMSLTDEDELSQFYENYPRINLSNVAELLNDERVKTANSIYNTLSYGGNIDYVHLGNRAEESSGTGESCMMDENGNEYCETYRSPQFFLKGNMFPSMIEFEDDEYNIVKGRFYTQEEINEGNFVCLVSEALANQNNLSVGDSINLLASDYGTSYLEQIGASEEDYKNDYEIIGIFSHNKPITPDSSNYDWISPYENLDNMILMPSTTIYLSSLTIQQKEFDYYASLEDMHDTGYYSNPENRPSRDNMFKNMYIDNAVLLLSDPLDVDKFVEDYSESLPQFTMLDANNDEFNRLAKPLDTLSMYANFIVRLVVINAIVIITLVTALTLKNREYEIGVLLSVGASKFKIISQFFVELALVAILGFSLAVGSGSLIAKRIGYTVLEYQISESDVQDDGGKYYYGYSIWDEDYTNDLTIDDLISEYEVSVSAAIILEIYILGLGIVFVSVIIPSFMIMRYNPKKILMNQN